MTTVLPNVTIIAETDDYLIINKPAGLLVHPDGKHFAITLCDWLVDRYPDIATVGEPLSIEHAGTNILIPRPGIVHRLDRDTSGVLVVAKNEQMFLSLKKQFQNHTIHKQYHAITYGVPREIRLNVTAPIGRSSSSVERWATGSRIRGEATREAQTYAQVTGVLADTEGNQYAYLHCVPKTGRTHQIRVHLQSVGHPIIGDSLYAGNKLAIGSSQPGVYALGFTRQALHAHTITFTDLHKKAHTFQAQLPADFVHARTLVIKQY